MKKYDLFKICLIFTLLFAFVLAVSAEEYIPMHTEAELSGLFSRVADYLQGNQEQIRERLDETESSIVTEAFVRAWGIAEYDDALPEQIDNAYEALYNAFLFLGLNLETEEHLNDPDIAESLYLTAYELLDQEYFDLLKAAEEPQENIDYAEYLRGIAEALTDDPAAFSEEETADWITDLYAELYMASGLKALDAAEKLPSPESLYAAEDKEDEMGEFAGLPNPIKEYETDEALTKLVGIKMPDLSEKFAVTAEFFATIGDAVAEVRYSGAEGASILLRLSSVADWDISGVYNAEFYENRTFSYTETEIYRYRDLFIGRGTLRTVDDRDFSFSVEAEGLSEDEFADVLDYFIYHCQQQRRGDVN